MRSIRVSVTHKRSSIVKAVKVLLSATNGGIANERVAGENCEIISRQPDEVSVTEVDDDQSLILELRVAEDDMGKVIGKQGRIAKAIRVVMKAAAIRENKRVVVEII